jgi:Tol biopolymer transport system component/DNA-binding SARP family transcriptional activator
MNDGCVHLRTLGGVVLYGPDGTQVRPVLAQPKRLALLLYLAAAIPHGFHRKDKLLALFWPEWPDGRARRALNRAVYFLRQSLDRTVLLSRGDEEVAVAEERLWCDLVAFEHALDAGELEHALEVYAGDFAVGFFVDGLAEFERWVESERGRLRGRALAAALALAEREETRGELALASHWAQRATTLAPHDERAAQRHIGLLDRAGDRAGALRSYEELASRLRDDLGVEPSPETRVLEAAVRSRQEPIAQTPAHRPPAPQRTPVAPQGHPDGSATPTAPPIGLPTEPVAVTRPRRPEVRRWVVWVLGAVVMGSALALAMLRDRPASIRLGRRTAVAVAPEVERWPWLSPDGSTVFYTVSATGGDELFAQQVDGGSPVPLTEQVPGSQGYGALSPGGNQLLFLGDDGLYVMPALGGQARRVVPGEVSGRHRLFWGAWAPDGERIVYSDRETLYAQAIRETDRTALVTGLDIHSPAWSPDGRWIAFVEGNPLFHTVGNTASSAIRIVPASGGEPVAVTDASALNTSPVWLPGRQALLFISDRDGGRDVYEVSLSENGAPHGTPVRITTGLNPERIALSADGRWLAWSVYSEVANIWSLEIAARDSVPLSRARQVTLGTQKVEAGAFVSPDGAWLYYDSDRSGNSDLWRLPLIAGLPQRLTTDPAGDFYPAVSPDGREVAFHSQRSGNRDIYVMPASGGTPVRVSTSLGEEAVPAWSPDGQALIWVDGDTIRIARRSPGDGSWGSPLPLLADPSVGVPKWSPDGRWISFASSQGFELRGPVANERRVLPQGTGVFWHTWSADSRSLLGTVVGRTGRMMIVAVPIAGGKSRLLAYADHPLTQVYGGGLAVSGGRLYFALVERRADVWVGEVHGR